MSYCPMSAMKTMLMHAHVCARLVPRLVFLALLRLFGMKRSAPPARRKERTMPHHLIATLLTLRVHAARPRPDRPDPQRRGGDSTIEIVFWAVGLLALAGLVYAAILALVNSKIQGIAAAQA